jgi:hypothetical protein
MAAGPRQVARSLVCLLFLASPLWAADEVEYLKDIKPLFRINVGRILRAGLGIATSYATAMKCRQLCCVAERRIC